MVVLVSTYDEEDDDSGRIFFEGVFADKDEVLAALPALLAGVEAENAEGESVSYDPTKHELSLEPAADEIEVGTGAAPTEQEEVMIDFGDDAEEPVETDYFLLTFDKH